MILCVSCTAETRDNLDGLVARGSYRNHGEAIEAAVRNLVLMEKVVAENGSLIIGGETAIKLTPTVPADPVQNHRTTINGGGNARSPARTEKGDAKNRRNAQESGAPPEGGNLSGVPQLFRQDVFPPNEPAGLAELPADMWSDGQRIPLDRWVLGQFNRLLPAKVNARALNPALPGEPKGARDCICCVGDCRAGCRARRLPTAARQRIQNLAR